MPNINKVVYGNTTLIDLSTTTLSEASQLQNGITAYDRAGNVITGTGSGGGNDFVVSLSKNSQTGYWEPDKTWSEVSAAIADNKTFVFCIAGMTGNSELAADGIVYEQPYVDKYLLYIVYETLQDQSNNYYTNECWYEFKSTGVTQDGSYVYYDTSNANATAADILSGKTAFTSSGSVSGSISSKTSSDLTANNLTVTAPSGYYASAASKTLTDTNLVAGNIKKDISIFGVTGTYEGGGGLPAVLDKVDAGTATLATSSDIIQVSHNLGRVPDFACIYQDLSDWADVAFGVCVLATYIRWRYTNSNETYNYYLYTWRYKHATSGNSLGGSSTMVNTNATATTFKFARGNAKWATVDANGNPVTYKWMVGTFKEAT